MIVPKIGCVTRLIVEAALIITVIAAFVVWQSKQDIPKSGDTAPSPNTVLERIGMTGECVTAVACVQSIIRSAEVASLIDVQVGSTELLYVGVGLVRAGINLTELDAKAIAVDGDKVTVTLPPCKILDEKIDVVKSYVFDVRRSLVLSPKAIHLQSAAEKAALQEIRQAAVQAGLLEQAEKQARILLTYWFQSAGFRAVVFRENGPLAAAPVVSVGK